MKDVRMRWVEATLHIARFHRRGALSEFACKPLLGLLCALSFSFGVELSQALPSLSEVA